MIWFVLGAMCGGTMGVIVMAVVAAGVREDERAVRGAEWVNKVTKRTTVKR